MGFEVPESNLPNKGIKKIEVEELPSDSFDVSIKTENLEKIEITTATPEDVRRIYEIKKQSWLDTYSASEYGLSREDIEQKDFFNKVEKLATRLQSGEAIGFVAKSDGVIVGYCTGVKKEDFNVLHSFHILKDFQGKGIGKQLIEGVLSWLGDDKPIVVDVAKANARAIHVYSKYGFIENQNSSRLVMSTLPNGKQIDNFQMIRPAKSESLQG